MQKLKTGYAYLFFFLYNYVNKFKNNILIKPKAIFLIILLEVLLILSVFFQYENINKTISLPPDFNRLNLLYIIIPLVIFNIWFFERNENWKKYLDEFNAWPSDKQRRWNWVMRGIVFVIFSNLILSYYWMSQIDWSLYRK